MKLPQSWQSTGSIVAERLGKVSELMLAMQGMVHLIPYMPKPFDFHHVRLANGKVKRMRWWDGRLVEKAKKRYKAGMKRHIFAELLTKDGEMTTLAKQTSRYEIQ